MEETDANSTPVLFDVLKLEPEGCVHWIGESYTLNGAMLQVEAFRAPGKYIICNRKTGKQTIVNVPSTSVESETL